VLIPSVANLSITFVKEEFSYLTCRMRVYRFRRLAGVPAVCNTFGSAEHARRQW